MSRMLNLVDALLSKGNSLQALGREHEALHILTTLSGFHELPGEAAEMTQAVLGEMHLERGRYRKARRHLTAALQHRPDCAHYHYLMAQAVWADGDGDGERAAEHYRRSLELDPEQPACLADYGSLAVEMGQTEDGLRSLYQAVEMAPRSAELLQKLVSGLCLDGRTDEARSALIAARFRQPRDARFRKLWEDFQFEELRQSQEAKRRESIHQAADCEGPVLLPFRRPEPEATTVTGRSRLRKDRPTRTPPPHLPRPNRLSDHRRAQ